MLSMNYLSDCRYFNTTKPHVVANVSLSQNTFHTTRLGSQADLDINLLNISRACVTH